MNPLPPNANDLVSAYLDGQAAPDEVTIVESSPELMERVAALRSVSNLLGAPLASPPEQKEAHISAALDTFDSLLASDNPAELAKQFAPPLGAVPPVSTESSPASEQPCTVASLSQAREHRRPRRFNSGVIAAAAAVVLLFVALAAFGLGGNDTLDVASTASDVTADAASDNARIESAEAMADEDFGGLSEREPAPAPPAAAAPQAAEAIEEAAMDHEEAAAEATEFDEAEERASASDESASNDAAASGAAEPFDRAPLGFLGEFATRRSLQLELDQLPTDDLGQPLEPGLFAGCQQDVPELADIEVPTLIGQAAIVDQAVEVHQIIAGDGTVTILIVDTTTCTVLGATP
jgi:hypothetical protein